MPDLLILGAGAAGLYAAGSAVQAGCRVTVLEHMPAPGKKLLISGKGRCNVANNCTREEFLKSVRHNPRFLYSALAACPPAHVMDVLETECGVPLKTERGRRVFPQSDRAQEILDALLRRVEGARIVYGAEARALLLKTDDDGARRCTGVRCADGREYAADAVLIATGGVSYPVTGSTGDGYRLAQQAGHAIVPPQPSLVALVEAKPGVCARMTGLSLRNVALTLFEDEKSVFTEQGEMLFTHFGVSGPLVLSASAYVGDVRAHAYRLAIDLKPALDAQTLNARICRDFAALANRDAANALVKLLPASMQPVAVELWGVDADKKVNQITREERESLVRLLKAFPVRIVDKGDLAHAIVTAGGVETKQVNPKTMESRLCAGLYFAGEVLDVDACTGGYNLGIAFATGDAAARAAAQL